MSSTFARRLMAQSVLMIGGSLTILLLVGALFIFYGYVQSLNYRTDSIAERIPEMFSVNHVPRGDADVAASVIASGDIFGLRVATFNTQVHVIAVAADPSGSSHAISFRRYPNNKIAPPVAMTLAEQFATALALAAGMRSANLTSRDVNVDIRSDPAVLAWVLGRGAVPMVVALALIWTFAYLSASLLNRQALRPLDDVMVALEAFAAGDLRPPRVDTISDNEFGRLARAYNEAVMQVAAAFEQRDRAESEIRRFIADAAHQLRTPLTVIQGFIGILRKNESSPADRERILESMDRQSRSMVSAIAKLTLLDHWEESSANPQLVDIGDTVLEIVQPLALAFPDREISSSQQPACYAFVDPGEIREALENVIDNAVKYGANGPVSVNVTQDATLVRIVVSDRGPGFSEDEREHAFERFYRGTQRSIAGSGLGLAIAKRAVDRARGSIDLQSARGEGTRVTITLPRGRLAS